MNIGILHVASRYAGGAYQSTENVIKCLKTYDNTNNNYVLFYAQKDFPYRQYESENWKTVFLKDLVNQRKYITEKMRRFLKALPFRYNSEFLCGKYCEIKNHDIDLLYCPTPSLVGYYCQIPYVVTIFDLMQKYYSEFPERPFLARKIRDIQYKRATSHAEFVVADSARGKEDLVKFYGIPEEKVEIFPGIPISYVQSGDVSESFVQDVRERFNLPEEYIFYPAHLWHHKNHIGIIKALNLLKMKHNIELTAVFTGSKKEAFDDIMRTVQELNMESQIMYLGYVSDEELQVLYKKAKALVMPTFFGPANIPVWEAFALGCPVITSNVYGVPEQVGDAGLLVNPRSIEDIADKIYRVYMDKGLREELSKKGLSRVKHPGLKSYTENLIAAFNKAVRA